MTKEKPHDRLMLLRMEYFDLKAEEPTSSELPDLERQIKEVEAQIAACPHQYSAPIAAMAESGDLLHHEEVKRRTGYASICDLCGNPRFIQD